jgi:hypothetical protein
MLVTVLGNWLKSIARGDKKRGGDTERKGC